MTLPDVTYDADVRALLILLSLWAEYSIRHEEYSAHPVSNLPMLLSISLTNQWKLTSYPQLDYPQPTKLGRACWGDYLRVVQDRVPEYQPQDAWQMRMLLVVSLWLQRTCHLLPPKQQITRTELWWLMLCTTSPLAGYYTTPSALFVKQLRRLIWEPELPPIPTEHIAPPVQRQRRLI